jgi:hypothetical protein
VRRPTAGRRRRSVSQPAPATAWLDAPQHPTIGLQRAFRRRGPTASPRTSVRPHEALILRPSPPQTPSCRTSHPVGVHRGEAPMALNDKRKPIGSP